MGRNIKDLIESPLPKSREIITLDTSIIIGLSGKSRRESDKEICQEFIGRSVENKNILCITKKTTEELMLICEEITFPDNKNKFEFSATKYVEKSQELYQSMVNSLNSLNNFYPEYLGREDSFIKKEVYSNSAKYGLRYNDSVILTQSLEEGVRNIATLDKDWKGISDTTINIYTTKDRRTLQRNKNFGQPTIGELIAQKLAK